MLSVNHPRPKHTIHLAKHVPKAPFSTHTYGFGAYSDIENAASVLASPIDSLCDPNVSTRLVD